MATADLSQISNNQVPRVINSMLYPKKKRSSFETVAFHKGPPEVIKKENDEVGNARAILDLGTLPPTTINRLGQH